MVGAIFVEKSYWMVEHDTPIRNQLGKYGVTLESRVIGLAHAMHSIDSNSLALLLSVRDTRIIQNQSGKCTAIISGHDVIVQKMAGLT